MTTIHFYFNNEHATTYCHSADRRDILNHIEEYLYILWELEPSSRNWKDLYARFDYATFDYHGTGPVTIRERWRTSCGSEIEILVEDAA